MAVVYVAEFGSIGGISNFAVAGAQVPPIAEQTISVSGTSAAIANAFNKNTEFVRIAVDSTSAVCLAWGAGATLTAVAGTNMRMNLNQTEYFSLPPFETRPPSMKVAAVTVGT